MALVDQNSTLGGLRGSVAGLVVSSAASGWYARTLLTPLTPRSLAQAEQRYWLARLASAWRALSSAQRAAFDTKAALSGWSRLDWFGNSYQMSGYGLFVALSMPVAMATGSVVSSAPDPVFPAAPTISAAALSRSDGAASGSVTFSAPLPAAAPLCRLWLTPAAVYSQTARKWRRALDRVSAHGEQTSLDLWLRCADYFGLPLVGQPWTVFFQVLDASGRPSAVVSTVIECTEA